MESKKINYLLLFLFINFINLFLIFQGYTNNTYILEQNNEMDSNTIIKTTILVGSIMIGLFGSIAIIGFPLEIMNKNRINHKQYKITVENQENNVIKFLEQIKIRKYYAIIFTVITIIYPLVYIVIRKMNNDQYINYFVLQYLFQILLSSLVVIVSLNISKRLLYIYSINYYKYYVIIFYYFIIYKFLEYLSQFQELNIIQYTILLIFIIINITWIILAYKTNYTYIINKPEIKLPKVIKTYPISKIKLINEIPLTKEEEKIFILLQEKAIIEEKDNITCLKYEDQYAIISDEQTDKCTPYNALIQIKGL